MTERQGIPARGAYLVSTIAHLVRGVGIFFDQTREKRLISFLPACNKQRKNAMMPPPCCRFLSKTDSLAAYVVGERIDAETCDGVTAGED
jgi:hypothetical protein